MTTLRTWWATATWRTPWERAFGLLALVTAGVSPFTCCLFFAFLLAALSLLWLAFAPRVLLAPRGRWPAEAARIGLLLAFPLGALAVAAFGNEPETSRLLARLDATRPSWLLLPVSVTIVAAALALFVVLVVALRLRLSRPPAPPPAEPVAAAGSA